MRYRQRPGGRPVELNFEGLVGPTHGYGGLAPGNLASARSRGRSSSPKQAALQGLAKIALLRSLGATEAILPPLARPNLGLLRRLGFSGSDQTVLADARDSAPDLLASVFSASSMWAANAATFAPSSDTLDHRAHLTVANLQSSLHRAQEAPETLRLFRAIFPDRERVQVHEALPASQTIADEGAANHLRFRGEEEGLGLHLFVYGRSLEDRSGPRPQPSLARQTREASEAVARLHRLPSGAAIFAQQNPDLIELGVFHSDVISTGHRDFFLVHERAFLEPEQVFRELGDRFARLTGGGKLTTLRVSGRRISVEEAIETYLFNSQLVSTDDQNMALVAPIECSESRVVAGFLQELLEDPGNPIERLEFVDLKQSMLNGGGPACLRLRAPLTPDELEHLGARVVVDDALLTELRSWVERHYRDRLDFDDLVDPALLDEVRSALDELTGILRLGAFYDFQREPSGNQS